MLVPNGDQWRLDNMFFAFECLTASAYHEFYSLKN